MASPTCAHLHVHSEYSLLDGACNIDALARRAAEFGQPALGLTDHGVMNGAVEHYKACRKHGIKPVIGCEIYYVDDHTAKGNFRNLGKRFGKQTPQVAAAIAAANAAA